MAKKSSNNNEGCATIIAGFLLISLAGVIIKAIGILSINVLHAIYLGALKYWPIIFIPVLIFIVFKCLLYKRLRKPITYEQAHRIAMKRAVEYAKRQYSFKRVPVSVNPEFKSNMDTIGRWYEIHEPLYSFPSLVSALLFGKHHEWVVIAIEKDGIVSKMWVNKGADNSRVSFNCDLDEIITKCNECNGYTIMRFHNHPNSDPSHFTTLVSSEQDKRSAAYCANYVANAGFNWLDFVCSRGEFLLFYSNLSNSFEVSGNTTSDIVDVVGISPAIDYALQKECYESHGVIDVLGSVGFNFGLVIIILVLFAIKGWPDLPENPNDESVASITEDNELNTDSSTEGSMERSDNETTETNESMVTKDGITYIISGKKAIVKGVTEDGKLMEEIELPEKVEGKKVREIGEEAFKDCDNLCYISLPESIRTIGSGAFSGCNNLKEIKIPDGVKSIPDSAFNGCRSLQTVILPEGIESIGKNAFWACSFESIELPSTLTTIGYRGFCSCTKLQFISIPEGVISLGKEAFKYDEALNSISLPDSLTKIGQSCFYGCRSLQEITIPEKIESLGSFTFVYCESLQVVYIPETCEIPSGDYPFTSANLDLKIIRY